MGMGMRMGMGGNDDPTTEAPARIVRCDLQHLRIPRESIGIGGGGDLAHRDQRMHVFPRQGGGTRQHVQQQRGLTGGPTKTTGAVLSDRPTARQCHAM